MKNLLGLIQKPIAADLGPRSLHTKKAGRRFLAGTWERTWPVFLAALCALMPTDWCNAETAQTRMYCLSLRFQEARNDSATYRLGLTTLTAGLNGELMPAASGNHTHFSYLELADELFGGVVDGYLYLDVPSGGDANGNGWPDFFEVAQPASGTSVGTYYLYGFASGTVQATWGREAGAATGTCILRLKQNGLYVWETFSHTFELLEYNGSLHYTPGSNAVAGEFALKRAGNESSTLDGPAWLVKVATNRFNQLDLQAGGWTNEAQQVQFFPVNFLDRDPAYPTNYYGYMDFTDGDPNTNEEDFYLWILSIDDINDTDHDGIPNLSDDPLTVLPRRSQLSLIQGMTNLWLTISGDLGRTNHVQVATNLASPNWQPVLSVKQTNDPQTVSLPLPDASPRFWRVLTQ